VLGREPLVVMLTLVVTAFLCGVMIFAAWEALIAVRRDGGIDVSEVVRSVQSIKSDLESRVKKTAPEMPAPPTVEIKTLASKTAAATPSAITDKVALHSDETTDGHSQVFHTTEEFFGHLTGDS